MAPTLQLDHLVIRVHDLDQAMKDFASMGFTVTSGGHHPGWGSQNALIPFADGSYLELIAFPSSPASKPVPRHVRAAELAATGHSAVECRVLSWVSAREGLVDFALLPSSLDDVLNRVRGAGVPMAGPFPGGRTRPDGQLISWQLGVPDAFDLPFLCADVTPRDLRVPQGAARLHANGAVGILTLSVGVTDLQASIHRYRVLLGSEPRGESDSMATNARTTDFALGGLALMLTETAEPGGHPVSPDQGPRSLWLQTTERRRVGKLDAAHLHGVPLQLVSAGNS